MPKKLTRASCLFSFHSVDKIQKKLFSFCWTPRGKSLMHCNRNKKKLEKFNETLIGWARCCWFVSFTEQSFNLYRNEFSIKQETFTCN